MSDAKDKSANEAVEQVTEAEETPDTKAEVQKELEEGKDKEISDEPVAGKQPEEESEESEKSKEVEKAEKTEEINQIEEAPEAPEAPEAHETQEVPEATDSQDPNTSEVEDAKDSKETEETEETEETNEPETIPAAQVEEEVKEVKEKEEKVEEVKEEDAGIVASAEGAENIEESKDSKESKESETPKADREDKEDKEEKNEVEEKPKVYPARKKETEKEILTLEVPTEEFDWDTVDTGGFGDQYQGETRTKMEEEYTSSLHTVTEKEVVKGVVVGLSARDVLLNIGFKSDGLVSATEFRDIPDLKIGDSVEVYVEEQENANGQLVLSRRKAKIVSAWENIKTAFEEDKVIEGVVKRRTKGGLIVDIFGVEAFLPGSQIDVKPIRDFDVFVDKKMEVKVVKINYSNDNVVVSHKVLIEKDLEKQKAEILNNLEKGQVLEGVIKNMTNFGVFIDLGGVDGLLHITDISWGRINHPEDVLNLDETVKIVVLDFDEDKKRISLGMKQLTPHPWDALGEEIEIGSKVKGKIVNVADYGAFLEISSGVEGLIHVSEMSWSQHLRNPSDFLSVGDLKEAVVITLDRVERKMSLGIKQLSEDPWTKQDVLTKYAIGTSHTGVIRNLTNFGLFIELEEGIDGLVHVSDLSWTKKIKHPSEFVNVSEELEVKVLELDVDNRRLALGHKQLEDNPWDTFTDVFMVGSVHKCTVISKVEKGAILELPYGLEGYANNRQLEKEDGSMMAEGETAEFKVLEFAKDDKRIVLSHVATYKEERAKSAPSAKKKPSAIEKINKKTEKDTLGDLDALSALKEQMETASKSSKPAAKKQAKVDEPVAAEKEKVEDVPKAKATSKAKSKKVAPDVVEDIKDAKEIKETKATKATTEVKEVEIPEESKESKESKSKEDKEDKGAGEEKPKAKAKAKPKKAAKEEKSEEDVTKAEAKSSDKK